MHGLVRCKHERRCSRALGADVSFRDVTIKIPDRKWEQGCEWRPASEVWADIWEKSVSWVPAPEEDGWLSLAHRGLAAGVARDSDGEVSIERWYLSPYVEKHFNSKVIKSFVPELRSSKCFFFLCVLGFLCVCVLWALWTFCVPVWICTFHIFISGTLLQRSSRSILQPKPTGQEIIRVVYHIYPTPPLGQDMTQGQFFLSGV